jgi:ATP-dependent Lon protease
LNKKADARRTKHVHSGENTHVRFTSDTGDERILSVTQRRADDNPAPEYLYRVGVTASVIDLTTLNDGTVRLIGTANASN